ncbi:MAG TPA: hypothetical protein VFW83_02525 [Bryobacteraceae bacterium]|nr:hypothetical protein [Bryobacteraceae bacterium]
MRKVILILLTLAVLSLAAGDKTKLTIHVTNDVNKPVGNASVIVKFVAGRSIKLTKIRKSWELRTSEQGSVSIPEIPQGKVLIQVIAKYYQTFGKTFDIDVPEKTVEIKLNPPQPQYSAH